MTIREVTERKVLLGAGMAAGLGLLAGMAWWLNEKSLQRLLLALTPVVAAGCWLLAWKRELPDAEGDAGRKNEAGDVSAPEERG